MAQPDYGIAAPFLRALAECVGRIGGNSTRFLEALGLADATPSAIPAAVVGKAIANLEDELGIGSAGIALAKAAPVGAFGFVDYAAYASNTLREAIARLASGYRHLSPRAVLVLEESGDDARIALRHRSGAPLRGAVLADLAFALLVLRSRAATGDENLVQHVRLSRRTSDPAAFEALFRARVSFGQQVDELTIRRACLDLPFATADERVASLWTLEEPAPSEPSILDRARRTMVRGLREGASSVEDLARELRISPRTLQRQLQSLGTSHRQLLDEARRALAEELLGRNDLPLSAVASQLGFATPTAFHRAFQRWTGWTPGAYRSAKVGAAPPSSDRPTFAA
jgi:AraC-like DNA-binding protein